MKTPFEWVLSLKIVLMSGAEQLSLLILQKHYKRRMWVHLSQASVVLSWCCPLSCWHWTDNLHHYSECIKRISQSKTVLCFTLTSVPRIHGTEIAGHDSEVVCFIHVFTVTWERHQKYFCHSTDHHTVSYTLFSSIPYLSHSQLFLYLLKICRPLLGARGLMCICTRVLHQGFL